MDQTKVLRLSIAAAPAGMDSSGSNGKADLYANGSANHPEKLLRLLSRRNMELLRLIRNAKPRSVAELARLSGRPKASLMITLRRLQKAGIVAIRDIDGRRKVPEVVAEKFTVDVVLGADA